MSRRPVSRRQVLAALGVGATAVTVGFGARPPAVPYTQYTYAGVPGVDFDTQAEPTDGTGHRVRVAWYESYNDAVVETQNGTAETNASVVLDPEQAPGYVAEAPGPVVSLSNVLPGDRGRLAVGIDVEQVAEGADGVALWYRLALTGNCENGVNEPEATAGDAEPAGEDCTPGLADVGELADALGVAVWEDTGALGLGACDGARGLGEDTYWQGSLADVDAALAGGVRFGGDGCFEAGQHRCLGLTWDLADDVGNVVQGDSATFDLTVVAVDCDAPNPFPDPSEVAA